MKVLILIAISGLLVFGAAYAKDPHHDHDGEQGPVGPQGAPGPVGLTGVAGHNSQDTGVSENDLSRGLSMAIAIAGMDFTSTTDKPQFGVAGATYDGKTSFAVGFAKVVDSPEYGDTLWAVKVGEADNKLAGVVSAVWNCKRC